MLRFESAIGFMKRFGRSAAKSMLYTGSGFWSAHWNQMLNLGTWFGGRFCDSYPPPKDAPRPPILLILTSSELRNFKMTPTGNRSVNGNRDSSVGNCIPRSPEFSATVSLRPPSFSCSPGSSPVRSCRPCRTCSLYLCPSCS